MSENRELLPELLTKRLILRQYTELDLDALFVLLSDREVNTFLPWFPVKTREEALQFLREHFLFPVNLFCILLCVCLQTDQIPIGYITVHGPDSYDFGYALRKEFWNQGIMTEGARAVVNELKRAGVPYVTATHDVNNPASGAVMRKLGMFLSNIVTKNFVQPKNISVIFRMYQLTLNAPDDQTYYEYWNLHPHHFIEPIK